MIELLLIEDDSIDAIYVKRLLERSSLGYRVTHVSTMQQALDRLANREFDVVLTDLGLPDTAGVESVTRLNASQASLPIVTLSGATTFASQAMTAGSQDYVPKSLLSTELLELATQNAIQRHALIRQVEEQAEQIRKNSEEQIATAQKFVDNVSHEFRTPLTVIREYAALMADGLLGDVNEEQFEFLNTIRCRVDDLNTMVDDMLDSSKLSAGILLMDRRPCHVEDLIAAVVKGLELKAQSRGGTISLSFEPDLPLVYCDPEKIGRVITNLVSNAIKFIHESSGWIRISATLAASRKDVVISVQDNGLGIPLEEQQAMFSRFCQASTTAGTSAKGFGLGLSIARDLVEHNYGEISVESEVGRGTTFRFTVPVNDWYEIRLRHAEQVLRKEGSNDICVVNVAVGGEVAGSRTLENFWRVLERPADLIAVKSDYEWTLIYNCDRSQMPQIMEMIESSRARVNRNRIEPLPPFAIKLAGCYTADFVVDAKTNLSWLDKNPRPNPSDNTKRNEANAVAAPKPSCPEL